MDVHLRLEAPSNQWVVELRRPGLRLTVWRSHAYGRDWAVANATALARFLGIPLTDEGGPRHDEEPPPPTAPPPAERVAGLTSWSPDWRGPVPQQVLPSEAHAPDPELVKHIGAARH